MNNLNTQSLTKAAGIGVGAGIVIGILSLIPILGIVFACLGIFVPVAVGALYGYFTAQEGQNLDYGPAAIGGGISAVVAGLVVGLFNLFVGLIFGTAMGGFSQFTGGDAAAAAGFALVGAIVGLCIGVFISAALGAIGGAVYVAVRGQRSTPAM